MKVGIYLDEVAPYDVDRFRRVSHFGIEIRLIVSHKEGPSARYHAPYWADVYTRLHSEPLFDVDFLRSQQLDLGAYTFYIPKDTAFLKDGYDIVVLPFGMPVAFYLLCRAKLGGVVTISWNGVVKRHSNMVRLMGEPLVRLCAHMSDRFVAYSRYAKTYLELEGAKPNNIVIIPNGVDTDQFNPSIDTTNLKRQLGLNNRKIVLYVGRLIEGKGIEYLLKAFSLVSKHVKESILLIVGTGPLKQSLKTLADQLNMSQSTIFTGPVPSSEINKYYAMCDVHIAPSVVSPNFIEPFGMVFIEAMACGKPTIGFDIPSAVRDIIVDGETGYLVPEKDSYVLADRMIELLIDNKKTAKMGKKARKRAVQEYDMNKIAKKWAETFKAILDEG